MAGRTFPGGVTFLLLFSSGETAFSESVHISCHTRQLRFPRSALVRSTRLEDAPSTAGRGAQVSINTVSNMHFCSTQGVPDRWEYNPSIRSARGGTSGPAIGLLMNLNVREGAVNRYQRMALLCQQQANLDKRTAESWRAEAEIWSKLVTIEHRVAYQVLATC